MRAKAIVVLFLAALTGSVFASNKAISKDPGVTVRTLVKGSPIHGSNGIFIGPDGNLYVASVGGHEIVKIDPDSGRILDRIGPERGVDSPDDLTFGPDGSLYWTSIFTGNVGRLFPDGSFDNSIANLGPGVNPITFSPDNEWVFVARDFLDKGLFKIRPDGSEPTPLLPDLVNFNGFDFGPDGWLYGPLYATKLIKVNALKTPPLDPATDVVDAITGIAPSAAKFDSKGRLVTNDLITGRILRKDLATGEIEVLATVPFSMDNLAIDARDQVYVSSDKDGYIAKILPMGNYVLISPGGMISPSGVAVLPRPDGGESVYVGDTWSIREFDGRTGEARSVAETSVVAPTLAVYPMGLTADGSDNLLVASAFGYVVQEYDAVNHVVLQTHADPLFPGVPFMPANAVRFNGNIVATDAVTGLVVQRFPGGWFPIFATGGGSMGLATNGADLWVSNYSQGIVYSIGSGTPVATGLSGPEGLAYYPPDGSLLVVETNAGRLTKINPATGAKTILAEGLEFGFHFLPDGYISSDAFIDGVAVGPSGAIYVTGNKADVLYRIEIHP
ncbi:MAG: hypothetical protein H6Q04_1056 [Acidobacteria bacterium]|nr:hypothetical protein [Acidobacteriota bacterium]